MAKHCKGQIFLSLTILTLLSHTHYSSPLSELDILISFKASIEDTKNSLSNWSKASKTHYCNWTGITCVTSNSSSTVTSINLQSLNLSGEISSSVCKLIGLKTLNLADNLFNQPIPLQLSECKSLESLNLSNNLIWGTIPNQISGFSSLKVLDFSKNHIEGKIPVGIGYLKSLRVLNFASNSLSGTLSSDSVFGNLTELVVLDLSLNTYLVSEIPSDIGKLEKLEVLKLQSSGFHGQIPDSFVGLRSLSVLDLSQNNLTGKVPERLGFSLRKLVSFDVSENRLSGSFPEGICGKTGLLVSLTLHTNRFTGLIPDSIGECLSLERFQVQDNLFFDNFPIGLWSLPKIKLIRAENNLLSGPIPESIAKASQLEQIQIDNNSFTGKIPRGLGRVESLYRFSASLNGFSDKIPPNFCDSPVMSIVNISHNSLSGEIPELKRCRKLVSLSLASNNFNGKIPTSLADLPVLTYLDLSCNSLTGPIPQGLQNLKLALFNVSFNKLSGKVPYSLISGLPASFLQGNPGLCGHGLPKSCSVEEETRNRHIDLTTLTCALLSLAFAVGSMSVIAGFVVYQRSHKRSSQTGSWRSVFFYPLRVSENDLIMAMDGDSAMGNNGAFGRVYVLTLPSGENVAVKKLSNFNSESFKVLKSEIKTLAKIRHKNVIKVLGFCSSKDSIFLIYEFQRNGSFGDLIGRTDFQMDWSIRMKIAIGVAQGLAYLHRDYVPHLLHRNVKSRNILLDEDFEPKLTDFALDRIVGDVVFQRTILSESPFSCYNAPEYAYSKKPTEQMDVYSFGVVLLELISGKPAERSETSDSLNIVQWVRRKVNITDGVLQVIDSKIASSFQKEIVVVIDIALRCTSVMPEKRPSMFEVLKLLQSLSSRTDLPAIQFSASEDGTRIE